MTDSKNYDLLVIGGGPGGYVAAIRAAQLGLHVACIEKNQLGGVCLHVGCIPSKTLLDSSEYYHMAQEKFPEHGIQSTQIQMDLSQMMQRKTRIVAELCENVKKLFANHHVDSISGRAKLVASGEVEVIGADGKTVRMRGKNILLATGSRPIALPHIPCDGKWIVDSTGALSFEKVPEHLVVVGGGYIGLELGTVWKRLGSKVTVVEMLPQIGASLDAQIARLLERGLKNQGMEFRLKTKVTKAAIEKEGVQLTLSSDKGEETLLCDRVLLAVGRTPALEDLGLEAVGISTESGRIVVNSSYRTNIPGIYAIGDIIPGPMLAHKASAEGIAAVECIAGLPGEVSYDSLPSIVYTWPEVASIGLTEEQLKERGVSYRSATYPFSGTARARCLGEREGLVKICAHSYSNRILGMHIIGPRASDLIAEGILAMSFHARVDDIARAIHGHPTFSEAIHEAALALTYRKG